VFWYVQLVGKKNCPPYQANHVKVEKNHAPTFLSVFYQCHLHVWLVGFVITHRLLVIDTDYFANSAWCL
jgi:hypothetical protein